MPRCVVTGAAGFIGSSLAMRLLADGWEVTGIDSFDPHYPRSFKERNLRDTVSAAAAAPCSGERFTFIEGDVATMNLAPYLEGSDTVFHLAARPGVRNSWGPGFVDYDRNNVVATQRLLQAVACAQRPPRRIVFASSSSVYGAAQCGSSGEGRPSREDGPLCPASPYGVTKLCCEHLCRMYAEAYGLSVVMLRYFTVYGPRQRPDMAIQRFIAAALAGKPVTVFGSGNQSRDFTYISDAVEVTVRAATFDRIMPGEALALNAGNGAPATVNEVLEQVAVATRRPVYVKHAPPHAGDVSATAADTSLLEAVLQFRPYTPLEEGIEMQVRWFRELAAQR